MNGGVAPGGGKKKASSKGKIEAKEIDAGLVQVTNERRVSFLIPCGCFVFGVFAVNVYVAFIGLCECFFSLFCGYQLGSVFSFCCVFLLLFFRV